VKIRGAEKVTAAKWSAPPVGKPCAAVMPIPDLIRVFDGSEVLYKEKLVSSRRCVLGLGGGPLAALGISPSASLFVAGGVVKLCDIRSRRGMAGFGERRLLSLSPVVFRYKQYSFTLCMNVPLLQHLLQERCVSVRVSTTRGQCPLVIYPLIGPDLS